MKSKTTKVQASFYCNHCDEWVDGIEDGPTHQGPPGIRQALCDQCGSTVMYRLPGFWRRLQAKIIEFFDSVLRSLKRF
jgi:hypothetical protein